MGASLATSLLGTAIGAAGGIAQFFEGRKMQRHAQTMIENFKWEDLNNPYKDLQVSTLGSDLQREEQARMSATSVNALQSGGNRAILGGLGRVQAQNNQVNREIAANLDQQQKQIDYAAAQDDTQIRQMIEQRQANELAGYGQMMNVGMGMKYKGIGDIMNSAFAGSQFIKSGTQTTDTGNSVTQSADINKSGTPLIDLSKMGDLKYV